MTKEYIDKYALYKGVWYLINQVSYDHGVLLRNRGWVLDSHISVVRDRPIVYR